MSSHRLAALATIVMWALAAGCAQSPPCACPPAPSAAGTVRYEPVDFDALPGWSTASLASSARAFAATCTRMAPGDALRPACESARILPAGDDAEARRFFESAFSAYAVVGADGTREGLVTGYYEPVLAGSRVRSERFSEPVYGVPEDLVIVDLAGQYPELRGMRLRGRLSGRRLQPYFSRGEIDARNGSFGAPVLAWVADPVELFFLQIQGSGQIALDTGERIRVGYAEQNGYPYRSLGRHLVERGALALEDASMQGIKAWATGHPAELRAALNHNASYVFFRELPATDGPIGAHGTPLHAGYSIAVDRRYVPLGAPVFLATTFPLTDVPLERLVVAQDTGGAIRGAPRADFYWGSGPEAGELAGRMKQPGRQWLLWPRGATLPVPQP